VCRPGVLQYLQGGPASPRGRQVGQSGQGRPLIQAQGSSILYLACIRSRMKISPFFKITILDTILVSDRTI
jgi:hypothetical protein